MENALPWFRPIEQPDEPEAQPKTGATTRFGGGGDAPVLVAVVNGPVEIEMAQDALQVAAIPAHIKRNSLGPLYGLSIGSFGSAEVWVPPALAERAYSELVGIGVIKPSDETPADDPTE